MDSVSGVDAIGLPTSAPGRHRGEEWIHRPLVLMKNSKGHSAWRIAINPREELSFETRRTRRKLCFLENRPPAQRASGSERRCRFSRSPLTFGQGFHEWLGALCALHAFAEAATRRQVNLRGECKDFSELLNQSLGQAIGISGRRKVRSNSVELGFDFMEPP